LKQILKSIYSFIPFKAQLFRLLRLTWHPGERIYKHLHFKGVINIDLGEKQIFKMQHYGYQLENTIFWEGLTGGWEKESMKLWVKLCRNAGTVFDLGANTGVYALVAKTLSPEAKVYAFEPVERVFEKLKHNITLNDYEIVPVQEALSNRRGTATIYDSGAEHIYSVTVNKNMSPPDVLVTETKIVINTLDAFIDKNNITNIDLMKIDVETHEPEVLEGFTEHLKRFKPSMLIEILGDEIGQKVEESLAGLGYLYFNIDERSGVRQVEKISKSDYHNFLLCQPGPAKELGLIK